MRTKIIGVLTSLMALAGITLANPASATGETWTCKTMPEATICYNLDVRVSPYYSVEGEDEQTVKVWNRPGGVTARVYANFYVGGDHPTSWNAFYGGANGVPDGDTYIGTINPQSITNVANTTKAELGFNNGSTNVTYCGYFVPNSASYSSGGC
jgi:hypothetical protein